MASISTTPRGTTPSSSTHKPSLEKARAIAPVNSGVDVVYYGNALTVKAPGGNGIPPPCADLSNTLPLQWYLEKADADPECARTPEELGENPPPVVIARPEERETLSPELEGYTRRTYLLRTFGFDVDIYYDPAAVPSTGS